MKKIGLLPLILLLWANSAVAQIVDVRLLAKERFGKPAQERPFPDLFGFTLRVSPLAGVGHPAASCPTASNAKGEVSCKVECKSGSSSLRLYVYGPKPESSPSLKGYVDPDPQIVEIEKCALKVTRPPTLVYRTPETYYAESHSQFTVVFQAAGLREPVWPPGSKLSLYSFNKVAGDLERLALADSRNLEGVQRLSKLSLIYQKLPQDQKDFQTSQLFSDYAVGGASVVLKAAVEKANGPSGVIAVSPSPEVYYRSVSALETELKVRQTLSLEQLKLYESAQLFKKTSPVGGIITLDFPSSSR